MDPLPGRQDLRDNQRDSGRERGSVTRPSHLEHAGDVDPAAELVCEVWYRKGEVLPGLHELLVAPHSVCALLAPEVLLGSLGVESAEPVTRLNLEPVVGVRARRMVSANVSVRLRTPPLPKVSVGPVGGLPRG